LAEWQNSAGKPAIYHCISRVVDRRLVFGQKECEAFRMYLRMYENFSGCRVLSYCVMSNHFHLLLEVPPKAEGGLSDEELLKRLSACIPRSLWRAWRRNCRRPGSWWQMAGQARRA
jgi:putative transposase